MNELSKEVRIAFKWNVVLSIAHGFIKWATLLTTTTISHGGRLQHKGEVFPQLLLPSHGNAGFL